MSEPVDQTLYDLLGVAPDATLKEIKRAWRKLAFDAHPDRGGDPALFVHLAAAFDVLSDPELRKNYDATGDPQKEKVINFQNAVAQMLSDAFDTLLDVLEKKMVPLTSVDIIMELQNLTAQTLQAMLEAKNKHDVGMRDYERAMKAVKHNGDGVNLFANILRDRITQKRLIIGNLEFQLRAAERLADELKRYTSYVDLFRTMNAYWHAEPREKTQGPLKINFVSN